MWKGNMLQSMKQNLSESKNRCEARAKVFEMIDQQSAKSEATFMKGRIPQSSQEQ